MSPGASWARLALYGGQRDAKPRVRDLRVGRTVSMNEMGVSSGSVVSSSTRSSRDKRWRAAPSCC